MDSGRVVLEARHVSKQYPGTLALDDVTFQLHAGRVSALIGENGAGKSTLVRILGGIEEPTSGALLLDGAPIRMHSVRDADAHGIGIIHQELNLCPNLNVAENIFLSRELKTRGLLDMGRQKTRAREILDHLEQPIDPGSLVGDLPLGQQQIVEIAKALARDVRVLMMDEPTSALSASEIEVLFRTIRELTSRGVAIVYISHRLEELLEIADCVSVLRDGHMVAEANAADVDTPWIVERMTGRAASEPTPSQFKAQAETVLRAELIALTSKSGRPLLRDVSLNLRAGEVLGIYGLMGAGRTELLECLMGLHPEATGKIWLGSMPLDRLDTPARIESGIAMVPEDRQTAGLVQSLSVRENMTLSSIGTFTNALSISATRERESAQAMVNDLRIKAPGIEHSIGSLSGGNQQKVVIAKCLLTRPKALLLDEPARGVDVGAKREIYALVRRLAEQGMGVVFVSSELVEVRLVSDRILVMSRGAITGEFSATSATGDALALAASSAGGLTENINGNRPN